MATVNAKADPSADTAPAPEAPPVFSVTRLSDGANPAGIVEDTVVFLRTYNSWMAGQSAGFVRERARELVRAGVARPYNPATDRPNFAAHQVRK